jgi:hypothetical protein
VSARRALVLEVVIVVLIAVGTGARGVADAAVTVTASPARCGHDLEPMARYLIVAF